MTNRLDLMIVSDPPFAIRRGVSVPGFSVVMPNLSDSNKDDRLVAIILRSDIPHSLVPSSSPRVCSVKIPLEKDQITIIATYCRPGMEEVWEKPSVFTEESSRKGRNV